MIRWNNAGSNQRDDSADFTRSIVRLADGSQRERLSKQGGVPSGIYRRGKAAEDRKGRSCGQSQRYCALVQQASETCDVTFAPSRSARAARQARS